MGEDDFVGAMDADDDFNEEELRLEPECFEPGEPATTDLFLGISH